MSIERIKIFFISGVNWVLVNSNEENGGPRASQMKSVLQIRTGGIRFQANFYRAFEEPASTGQVDCIEQRKGKGVRRGANAFPIRLGAWHTRPLYIGALGFVRDYLWRRFINFKLRAHFLDLRGLLFHHCRVTRQPCLPIPRSSFVV